MIFILGIFSFRQRQFIEVAKAVPADYEILTMKADQYKLNGDLVTGMAKVSGTKVFALIKLTNQKQKIQLRKNDHNIQFEVADAGLTKISPPTNQAEFDFKTWAAHRQISYQVQGDVTTVKQLKPASLSDWIAHFRKQFLNRTATQPKYCAFHLRALVAGYTNNDDLEIRQLLSTLGIIHLFALSGLHVDLLIKLVRKLGSSLHIIDEISRGLLLVVLPIYAIFVGGQVGILRAILSYFIRELSRLCHLRLASLDQLTLVLLICLWFQPAAMLELGPQLSFTLALALRLMPRLLNKWQVQLKLGYLTMGFILFWTYTFNLFALVMGALFAPLFSILILPLTLLNLVVPRSSLLIEPLWQVLYHSLEDLNQQLPLQLTFGSLPVFILVAIVLIGLFGCERLKFTKRYFAIALMPFLITYAAHQLSWQDKVTVLDIGQGDSILVQTAFPKRTLLIDTGGQLHFKQARWQRRDTTTRVEKITLPYLRSQGISHLDYVLLSHQDADHLGDLSTLLAEMPVTHILFTKGMEQNPNFIKKLQKSRSRNRYLPKLAGLKLDDGHLQGQFIAPQKEGLGDNEDSLSVLLKVGTSRWLFTGDLDREHELESLDRYPNLPVDYLKVGHHGSKTASDPAFIEAIQPKLAIISAGRNNRYHHPNEETLTTFAQQGLPYLNTADYGMIEWQESRLTHHVQISTKLMGDEEISGQSKK
ncbi:DNA internalization-related competence protein ComEC/Rec2 [Lapidilactobacillus mulanensis]|uniref:DNA internalization-related competence protein ComEC/Rec2 n=1 Tax=Lapidilactobacillus mulanensis TaxID=2485999 RepID=A0ABW4DQ58_9LACO|nr:DNA internalization-related competence protein ComEC/Rec2 [Lapidilactobacillus mulanensis]